MAKFRNSPNIQKNIVEDRQAIVRDFVLPIQRNSSYVIGPVFIALCAGLMIYQPCWQFAAVLGVMVITTATFFMCLRKSLKGEFMKYHLVACGATMAILLVAISLVDGLTPVVLVASLLIIIQMTVFSRFHVFAFSAVSVAIFVIGTLIAFFEPFEQIHMSSGVELGVNLGAVAYLFLQVGMYAAGVYKANERIFGVMEHSSESQNRVIETVNSIRPVIDEAVQRIERISAGFASQAGEQATATAEVNSTVSEVMQIAAQSSQSAQSTGELAAKSREELLKNSRKMTGVVEGFEEAVTMTEASSQQISKLAILIGQIEEILNQNRAIGEHIKVLAVNASIESAKAGEAGKGFQVVATELRDMIQNTDRNISDTRAILDQIRRGSKESMVRIKDGAMGMRQLYGDLRETGKLVEESAVSFMDTAQRVQQIAHAASEQQVGIREIGTTMGQIDQAAAQLSESASELLDAVAQISRTQEDLHAAFD